MGSNPALMMQSPATTNQAVNNFAPAASQLPNLGVNVVTPGMPPIINGTTPPPPSHQADGRAVMVCSGCHQVQDMTAVAAQINLMQTPQPLAAQPQTIDLANNPEHLSFSFIYNSIKQSVVNISSTHTVNTAMTQPQPLDNAPRYALPRTGTTTESIGSGVIVSRNGYVITNNHVVADSTQIIVTVFDNAGPRRYSAEMVKTDVKRDLALLKITPDDLLSPATLGRSEELQVGDSVISIGSPYGLDQTVSRGIISGLRKSITIGDITHERMIQTDAAINQGNSGGALIDRHGEVIGINTAIYTPTGAFSGIGFAIPSLQVRQFLNGVVPGFSEEGIAPTGWADNFFLGKPVAAVTAPPIRANAAPPGNHQDGRNQMACATCHQLIGGGNQVPFNAGGTAGSVAVPPATNSGTMGQTIAAPSGPPIAANAPTPGNHLRDGRDKVACSQCHLITGGAGQPVAFALPDILATPIPVAVQNRLQAPRITAGMAAPHTDGREKMDCRICHQVNPAPGGAAVAFTTPQKLTPGLGVYVVGPNQIYLEGAVIEPITPLIIQRINVQVSDGAFVSTVYPDTAAARAGLQAGDIVFKLNGRWVLTPNELVARVAEYQVGDNLRLGVYTGGQRRNLYLTVTGQAEMPLAAAAPTMNMGKEVRWLGMELKPITAEVIAKTPALNGKQGSLVGDVDKLSAAANAGVLKGDIVKRINGIPANSTETITQQINSADLVNGVLFLIERDGRNIYLTLQG
ncbi:MAG: trypsin-like peptidase domain-containing protein [Gammaproteobacteria bacterium]|nr:trypsin-like peptidase domain-containing protein [Gammaproteobacteria bacterium]